MTLANRHWLTWMLLAYAGLVIYGSLYPLTGWQAPSQGLLTAFAESLGNHASRADMVVNLLVYIPFGLLFVLRWARYPQRVRAIMAATLAGFMLSVAMESIQLCLPSRTPSLLDLILNTAGTTVGAALPYVQSDRFLVGRRLRALRLRWIDNGPLASFGLLVIGVWALSQLTPFVPSFDSGNLRAGLSPLYHAMLDPASIDPGKTLAYALALLGVGLVAVSLLRVERMHRWPIAGMMLVAVLLMKIPVVARSLSAEALLGAMAALVAMRALAAVEVRQGLAITALCLLAAYITDQLRPGTGVINGEMHWQLFSMQMLSVHGLQDILAGLWPFLGLCYIAQRAGLPGTAAVIGGGAGLVALIAGTLEWAQGHITGRHPDMTDVLLAVIGWALPWLNPALRNPKKLIHSG